MKQITKIVATLLLIPSIVHTLRAENSPQERLLKMYRHYCTEKSDIYEHVPVLKNLASQCSSVTELGVRHMVSTWGILQGLSESTAAHPSYLGVDLEQPTPEHIFQQAQELSAANGISFEFLLANDRYIEIEETDMLFIDTMHTYCHLLEELLKFAPKTRKYIAMHDTSAPWGDKDADDYFGDYSEYPAHFDRSKRGLWAAVEDFLKLHPEWYLYERRFNNHGFTILKRIGS
jgi:hypothetical protein